MKKLGIYIHIPFCSRKCSYCDFYSVKWNEEIEIKYINSLITEIKSYKELSDYTADTIYFGGGTPTIIKPININRILESLSTVTKLDSNLEVSLEANPNTLTSDNLSDYKSIGINRISIGIQSLNDNILESIGRLHNRREAIGAIEKAVTSGFKNINADIMFNIPGQTVSDIKNTLNEILNYNVKHISFYSLKLEKGTPLYLMEENNIIDMPEEEVEREMYYAGRGLMDVKGLKQYEISNFAKIGFECRHNLKYWNQEEYIGFGPSAHSFMNRKRFNNPMDINLYIKNAESKNYNKVVQEILDYESLMFEYIMLKLRLTEGLDLITFEEKFSVNFVKKYKDTIDYLIKNNLIELNNHNIRLTYKGMDISNFVFQKFM